jgi:hypothetical protein
MLRLRNNRRNQCREVIDMEALDIINRATAWLRRYLPAELIGTLLALLCAWLAAALTDSPAATALAGTWGENLGFYGLMLARELTLRGVRRLPTVVCELVLEFGLAESLDSLLLRPALMYAGMRLAQSPALGIVAGKLAADIVFYIPTIASYELLRRRQRPTYV